MSKSRLLIPVAFVLFASTLTCASKAGSNLTTIASFTGGIGGANPFGDVAVDSAGNVYGTTYSGGTNNYGTIFEIASGSHEVTTVANFSAFNNPTDNVTNAGIIVDSAGNIYGTTEEGGSNNNGTLYEVVKGSNTITTLASFSNSVVGSFPANTIAMDAAGNIYGTTLTGGAHGGGEVYEFVRGTGTFKVLADISGVTGGSSGNIAIDAAGNVYGTTGAGTKTVWEVVKGSNAFSILASIGGGALSGATLDSAGNLFGTQSTGSRSGTVWELANGSHTITTLAILSGAAPLGGVTLDADGNIYGTAFDGSGSGTGSVYEVVKGSGVITTLDSFPLNHGVSPLFGVTLDSSGNIYGATGNGGTYGDGSVFEISSLASVPEPPSILTMVQGAMLGLAGLGLQTRCRRAAGR